MIDQELLNMLVCPENRTRLALAGQPLVEKLNRAIAAGAVTNRAGEPVSEKIDAALVRQDKALVYPIRDGIAIMLIDEAIPLEMGFEE